MPSLLTTPLAVLPPSTATTPKLVQHPTQLQLEQSPLLRVQVQPH